jgi:macrolide transport system ATP-binding/permease protein
MKTFLRKLHWLKQRRRKEEELNEELQFHLSEETEQRQAEGFASEAALRAARLDLGNLTLLREETRAAWSWTVWEQLVQDLRYALRTMNNNRVFVALAILSLALGIGANTAIYSFMDSILLRSLPVANPESLVVLNWHAAAWGGKKVKSVVMRVNGSIDDDPTAGGVISGIFPYPAFELLHNNNSVFSSVFGYYPDSHLNVRIRDQADLTTGEFVSGDYFRGLGVPPAAGRLLQADDDRAGAAMVAVISYAYSAKRFDEPSQAIGNSILINNVPFTIAGVTPLDFFGVDPGSSPDVYLPMHANLLLDTPDPTYPFAKHYLDTHYYWIQIMGRLRPGVSVAQAQATVRPMFQEWVLPTASNDQERVNLPALLAKPGGGGVDSLRRQYSKPLYVLVTLAGLILLIACSNIANLLLARATARRREMAVRLSMGAGRLRVIRQLLTESVLLSSLGGAAGVLFAVWGIRFLTALLSNGREHFTLRAELNWHVLAGAAGLSILTGILFGLLPAIQSARADVLPALKNARTDHPGERIGRSFAHLSLGRVLLIAQIAISLLMLVACGLFVRTLSNLQSIRLGFNSENLLLFQMNARQAGHSESGFPAFYQDLQTKFRAIPGVRSVTLSNRQALDGGRMGLPFTVQGKVITSATIGVGPSFFNTFQIPLLAGRDIDDRDVAGPAVAVVNQLFAKANFGDENPLGRHLTLGANGMPEHDMQIVGVCANVRYGRLQEQPPPVVYFVYNHTTFPPPGRAVFALRTAGNPLAYVNTVRKIVHQADPNVPLSEIKTQALQIDQLLNQEIIFARLCTAFAILALTITGVGLYGSVSYSVSRRNSEIGIRMALGAQRSSVLWMILGEVFSLAAVGLAIGVPAAFATSKFIAAYLFGMKPNDPLTLALAVTTLLAAAFSAAYIPARRASQMNPMAALRNE